jgi:hypothetical protein
MVADAAYPAVVMLVIAPVGTSTRARTSPSRRNPAVNHHSPEITARDTMAKVVPTESADGDAFAHVGGACEPG